MHPLRVVASRVLYIYKLRLGYGCAEGNFFSIKMGRGGCRSNFFSIKRGEGSRGGFIYININLAKRILK